MGDTFTIWNISTHPFRFPFTSFRRFRRFLHQILLVFCSTPVWDFVLFYNTFDTSLPIYCLHLAIALNLGCVAFISSEMGDELHGACALLPRWAAGPEGTGLTAGHSVTLTPARGARLNDARWTDKATRTQGEEAICSRSHSFLRATQPKTRCAI